MRVFVLLLLLWASYSLPLGAQDLKVLFYNVENFFDTVDDARTVDEEFTPNGARFWTQHRMIQKGQNIAKAIIASSEWSPYDIIGLAEVESREVIEGLINKTPLKQLNYKIIHFESPDRRGIDVALLYRPNTFSIISATPIAVKLGGDTTHTTRDILLVEAELKATAKRLFIFVNHWPSRYGGVGQSEPYRLAASEVLSSSIYPLLERDENVLVMGDFNDNPTSESIESLLETSPNTNKLTNLMLPFFKKGEGTLYFQQQWYCFDQYLVHSNSSDKGFLVKGTTIKSLPAISKETESRLLVPYRTYLGYRYQGGYSDHYPIELLLSF